MSFAADLLSEGVKTADQFDAASVVVFQQAQQISVRNAYTDSAVNPTPGGLNDPVTHYRAIVDQTKSVGALSAGVTAACAVAVPVAPNLKQSCDDLMRAVKSGLYIGKVTGPLPEFRLGGDEPNKLLSLQAQLPSASAPKKATDPKTVSALAALDNDLTAWSQSKTTIGQGTETKSMKPLADVPLQSLRWATEPVLALTTKNETQLSGIMEKYVGQLPANEPMRQVLTAQINSLREMNALSDHNLNPDELSAIQQCFAEVRTALALRLPEKATQ